MSRRGIGERVEGEKKRLRRREATPPLLRRRSVTNRSGIVMEPGIATAPLRRHPRNRALDVTPVLPIEPTS